MALLSKALVKVTHEAPAAAVHTVTAAVEGMTVWAHVGLLLPRQLQQRRADDV